MANETKNVLSLESKEAMDFFLKSEQYHGFELPEYFVFDELLQNVKNAIGDIPYEECIQDETSLENLSDVNLDILLNKDGRYAVRPIILANPFLYYFLVREICNEQSWTLIKKLFEKFQVPHITSCALPVIPKEKRMEDWLKPYEEEVTTIPLVEGGEPTTEKITKQRRLVGGSIRAMSAICTQIALENVGCCHYALRVLSRMVDSLKDKNEKSAIISLVYSKLCNQPNSDYNQLWLQNITYQQDKKNGTSPYNMRLCCVVAGDKSVELWNNKWVKPELLSNLHVNRIVNAETLKKVTPVIMFRERRAYDNQFYLPTEEEIRESETIATF